MVSDSYTFRSDEIVGAPVRSPSGKTVVKMVSKWRTLAPIIATGVVLVALIAAVIGVSVVLHQKAVRVAQLEKDATDHAAAEHRNASAGWTTWPPGQASLPTSGPAPAALYRLPRTVIPSRYDLFLQIRLPGSAAEETTMEDVFTTKGSSVAITLKTLDANVNSISLHASTDRDSPPQSGHVKRFAREAVSLMVGGAAGPEVTEVLFWPADVVMIRLAANLVANTNYVLKINFDGVIANDSFGLYRSSFMDGQTKRWVALTQFQTMQARRAFPCFDEPGIRSVFSTTLKYPKQFTRTRSNSDAQAASTTDAAGWTTTKFLDTPYMPVYLNAFLVSDFSLVPFTVQEPSGVSFTLNIIGNKALLDRKEGQFAGEQGKAMMEKLFVDFQQPYPLTKLDMAGVPDFNAGAMENWGLVLYRESSLMYRPKVSTADQKRAVAALIAHELAHMIFGNMVTCEWWSDTWLNEGFARFMQFELLQHTKPKWNVADLFSYWVQREAMQPDSYEASHPLYNPNVNTPGEINAMFDVVSYGKGASILHMAKGVMTAPVLYSALRKYVTKYRYGSVTHDNLLDYLAAEMPGAGLKSHLKPWIEQSGYPVLKLQRDSVNLSQISYSQERFLLSSGAAGPSTASGTIWDIPVTLTDGLRMANGRPILTDQSACWLKGKTGVLTAECPSATGFLTATTSYVIANVQQTGFYRVNYDEANWNKIIDTLRILTSTSLPTTPHLLLKDDSITRGQLIDDAFNLARVGKLADGAANYKIPLTLVNAYLPRWETKYGPLASAMNALTYIDRMLRGTAEYQNFADFMRRLISPLYRRYSPDLWTSEWNDADSSPPTVDENLEASYDRVMFNNLLLDVACYYGVDTCLEDARIIFADWWAKGLEFNPSTTEDNSVQSRTMALCYGVRDSLVNWNRLKTLYDKPATTTGNKLVILHALACTRHENLLHRVLDMSINSMVVRPQDIASVVGFVTRFPEGAALAWEFVHSKWARLTRRTIILPNVAGNLKDNWRLEQLRDLYNRAMELGGKDIMEGPDFLRAIARVRANIDWVDKYASQISSFVATLR